MCHLTIIILILELLAVLKKTQALLSFLNGSYFSPIKNIHKVNKSIIVGFVTEFCKLR